MKTIKFSLIAFIIMSVSFAVYADSLQVDSNTVIDSLIDSTASVVSNVTEVTEPVEASTSFDWSKALMFIFGLYELFVRLYPTEKNYSMLSIFNSILNYLIPNKKKQGGTH